MTDTVTTERAVFLGPALTALESLAAVTPPVKPKKDTFDGLHAEFGLRMGAATTALKAQLAAGAADIERLKGEAVAAKATITDLQMKLAAATAAPSGGVEPDPVTSPAVIIPQVVLDDPDRAQAYKLGRGELFDRVLSVTGGEGLNLIKLTPNTAPKGSRFLDEHTLFLDGPPTPSAEFDLSGLDTNGVKIYWTSPYPVRMIGGRIATNPQRPDVPIAYQGPASDDAKFTFKNVTVDQWSDVVYAYRQMALWLPTVVDGENIRFVRTACTIANFGPGQKVKLRDIYFESCGENPYRPKPGMPDDGTFDHPESFHNAGGEFEMDRFIADYRTKPATGTGMAIHQWRIDNAGYPDGLALLKNGFVLMGPSDMYYAIQLAYGSSYPGKTRLENIAWRQTGTGPGRPGNNQLIDDQNNARLSGFGNINFDTGEALWGRINSAT